MIARIQSLSRSSTTKVSLVTEVHLENSKLPLTGVGILKQEFRMPETSLEEFVTAIPPGDEKTKFLAFIRRMLTWDPEARAPSHELFSDAWFRSGIPSSGDAQ